MTNSVLRAHEELKTHNSIDIAFSGSTLVSVLIRGDLALCANVGDSRAVIGRYENGNWKTIELSEDQKPDSPGEQARLEAAGGLVQAFKDMNGDDCGPARIWIKGSKPPIPGLAMSRSIGDSVAAQAGVIANPIITEHRITPADKFLILASDGVWEFLSSERVVDIVSAYWTQKNIDSACDHVVRDSVRYWKQEDEVIDDITIIVIYLNVT